VEAGDAFDLTPKAISKAKADTAEVKDFSLLSTPKTPRDKMKHLRKYLDEYFASIGPVSGMLLFSWRCIPCSLDKVVLILHSVELLVAAFRIIRDFVEKRKHCLIRLFALRLFFTESDLLLI
jgi:hypothetical protein